MNRELFWFGAAMLLAVAAGRPAAAQRSWDGGNGTFVWGDFGNWNPDGNPNGVAISIGDLPAAANDTTRVDAAYSISSLSLGNGADVINSTDLGATTEFELIVNGATIMAGAGTSITIYGGVPDGLDTDSLALVFGATLNLNSERAVGTAVLEVDNGALVNNVDCTVFGNGRIDLEDAPGVATVLLNNEGTLTAASFSVLPVPPPTTLQITATSANARVDLDGANANHGIVNVNRNATLEVDAPINDAFSGDLNLAGAATLDIAGAWAIDGGTVDLDTGGSPAAHLAGGAISLAGGTITLGSDDSLVIDANITGSGGAINNSGIITFNAPATMLAAVDFNMLGGNSALVVNSVVNIDTPDFNLDGSGSAGNVTTINAGGNLDLDLGAGADEDFQHTINLNGGELDVTTADNSWGLNLGGVINAGGAATSHINGETFLLTGTGGVNLAAGSQLNVNAATEITGTPTFNVAATGVLNFSTVTYANSGAVYTGAGILRKGTAMVTAATTWNVATVDLDDGATTLNADLTINAGAIDDTGDGLDSSITISDAAELTVNITGGGGWAVDSAGTITYNGDAERGLYLAGSDVALNGTLNHTGDGRIDARLDIGATGVININTADEPLLLFGGDGSDNPNTIAGGTITGAGYLVPDALHGFGTIDTRVYSLLGGSLRADDGILKVNGEITQLHDLGTADEDGVLNVTNAWNTDHTSTVELQGGELRGATITNNGANGINGHGLVSAPVINNTRLDAEGGALLVETPGNINDWDGAGAGQLNAILGDLEIRDNQSFDFTGTVNVAAGRTLLAGFNLNFDPGSTLNLTNGTYRSQLLGGGLGAVHIAGTVTVNAGGPSTLQVVGLADFANSSATTLNDDLLLDSFTTDIRVGADFVGSGALVILPNRYLHLEDGVVSGDLAVLIENRGNLELGLGGGTLGQISAVEYQAVGGDIRFDLGGTGLNDFDRLTLTGPAALDGRLNIRLLAGYLPALGDTLDILSAGGGITGTFASVQRPLDMPGALMFDVVYSPTLVQLMVVPILSADFDLDGDVDGDDLAQWQGDFGLNGDSDADGDGDSDGGDFLAWQRQLGSAVPAVSANSPVPEPPTSMLVVVAAVGIRRIGGRMRQELVNA